MRYLTIETSSPAAGVCLAERLGHEHHVLYTKTWVRKKAPPGKRHKTPSHSELAGQYIEQGLKQTGLNLSDFDFFYTSNGPGSFTGIRVGVNIAKAYCYALNKPLKAMNSLKALALNARLQKVPILCLVNAFKNQMYVGRYEATSNNLIETLAPCSLTINDLEGLITAPHLCLGDGYDTYSEYFSPGLKKNLVRSKTYKDSPRVELISEFLSSNIDSCPEKPWKDLAPLYIRQSEAEEKLSKGLLKPLPKL